MSLLALPAMLKAGYDVKISAGDITAGGCLGIMIPPSVLLIVYGAVAGVSVVKLYAAAFFPGIMLAFAYRQLNISMLKESIYLTAKTSAMVCWLFVGSSIFSAAFALLGGQEIINAWVLSMDLTPVEFMIMAQIVIFLLGWPL